MDAFGVALGEGVRVHVPRYRVHLFVLLQAPERVGKRRRVRALECGVGGHSYTFIRVGFCFFGGASYGD